MLAAVLSVALLAITLAGCATGSGSNGDNVARDWARTLAEEYAYDINGLRENRTADYLAANIVSPEPNPDGSSIVVEALSWTGVSNVGPGARVELRYIAHVSERSGPVFGSHNPEGDAVRCYAFTVLYNNSEMEEIDCPRGPAPAPPTPAPLLVLPEDAVDRLAATLANATPETLKADVLAAFPEDYLFIDTVVDSGRLIVAMRATDNSDCIVVMRDADGTVEQAGFDPIWAEPGETGCTTGLVTNPPL